MADPLDMTIQGTPNPNAAKFTLNRVVVTQGTTYRPPAGEAGDAAAGVPAWAQDVLRIPGVTQVFALNNFISVTKTGDAD